MKLLILSLLTALTSQVYANQNLDTKLRELLSKEDIRPIHVSGNSRSALFVLGKKLFSEMVLVITFLLVLVKVE
jgi:hypothetical protein